MIILSSPGLADIVSFALETTKRLHLVKRNGEMNDIDAAMSVVTKRIEKETIALKERMTKYSVNTDVNLLTNSVRKSAH